MLNRVDIKDAVNPSQKILAQLGLTPVLSNPFNHLMVMARIKKNRNYKTLTCSSTPSMSLSWL